MRGPKPIPPELKILTGEKRKERLAPDRPMPSVCIPDPPKHLSLMAQKEWDYITPELARCGILAAIDRTALANYCQAVARLNKAELQLEKEELTVETIKGSMVQNPLIGIINRLYDITRQYAVEFGMTPSSRSRVKVPQKDNGEQNKWKNLG